ncbi:MAG: hypothetical protein LCH91_05030 [Bacteroidetes bacterium]|nr:hypothetical protein [Bacteroidota bacterium]
MKKLFLIVFLAVSCHKQHHESKKLKKIDNIDVSIKLVEGDDINNNLLELTLINNTNNPVSIHKTPELFIKVEVLKNNSWIEYEWLESEEAIDNGKIMPFYKNDTLVFNKEQIFYKTDLIPHKEVKVSFSFNVIYTLKTYLKKRIYFEYKLPNSDKKIMSEYFFI